jgi:hypothetical protein
MNPREMAEEAFRRGVGVRDLQPAPQVQTGLPPTSAPAPAPQPPAPVTPAPSPPETRPVLGPQHFPTVPNAARLQLAGPETEAEQLRRVSTAESVKNGEWARHRGHYLGKLGAPPQISSNGTVYAAGLESAPASEQRTQQHQVHGSIQQPHGHPMTGPIPPLLAAKYQQMRERKRAMKARR